MGPVFPYCTIRKIGFLTGCKTLPSVLMISLLLTAKLKLAGKGRGFTEVVPASFFFLLCQHLITWRLRHIIQFFKTKAPVFCAVFTETYFTCKSRIIFFIPGIFFKFLIVTRGAFAEIFIYKLTPGIWGQTPNSRWGGFSAGCIAGHRWVVFIVFS